ncbi:UNVERIFIED_CONTAM: uncharacterized protein YkuJ [Paenibacillus sp. PvR008]
MRDGSASDGSNQYKDKSAEQNNFGQQKTQEDIANDLNITTQQLRNYKKLLTLIPELQDMVEDQELKATTATLIHVSYNKGVIQYFRHSKSFYISSFVTKYKREFQDIRWISLNISF